MGASVQPGQNHLLGALPPTEAQRRMPLLASVDLPLGHVLYESGTALGHVYFQRPHGAPAMLNCGSA
jgi:hypothetical protein